MYRELLDAYGLFYEEEVGGLNLQHVLDVVKDMIRHEDGAVFKSNFEGM